MSVLPKLIQPPTKRIVHCPSRRPISFHWNIPVPLVVLPLAVPTCWLTWVLISTPHWPSLPLMGFPSILLRFLYFFKSSVVLIQLRIYFSREAYTLYPQTKSLKFPSLLATRPQVVPWVTILHFVIMFLIIFKFYRYLASIPSAWGNYWCLRIVSESCWWIAQHTFDVVRSAGSTTYNYANPVRRDVVSIGSSGDNVTIRFVTDNAGPWFLHWWAASLCCHIHSGADLLQSWLLATLTGIWICTWLAWRFDESFLIVFRSGLAVVLATDPEHTKDRVPIPGEQHNNELPMFFLGLTAVFRLLE